MNSGSAVVLLFNVTDGNTPLEITEPLIQNIKARAISAGVPAFFWITGKTTLVVAVETEDQAAVHELARGVIKHLADIGHMTIITNQTVMDYDKLAGEMDAYPNWRRINTPDSGFLPYYNAHKKSKK